MHWVAPIYPAAVTAVASLAASIVAQSLLQGVRFGLTRAWHWFGAPGVQASDARTAAA